MTDNSIVLWGLMLMLLLGRSFSTTQALLLIAALLTTSACGMRVRLRRQYRFHVMPAADKKTRSRRDTRFSPF